MGPPPIFPVRDRAAIRPAVFFTFRSARPLRLLRRLRDSIRPELLFPRTRETSRFITTLFTFRWTPREDRTMPAILLARSVRLQPQACITVALARLNSLVLAPKLLEP